MSEYYMRRARSVFIALTIFWYSSLVSTEASDQDLSTTNKITFKHVATWPGFIRGFVEDVKIVKNHAFALIMGQHALIPSQQAKLVVYEITQGSNLVQKSVVPLNALSAWPLCLDSHYAYIGTAPIDHSIASLTIVDIADPDNPRVVERHTGFEDAKKIVVSCGKVFVLEENARRVQIIDVSNPTNLVKLGVCTSETEIRDFVVVQDHVYLLSEWVSIWDIGDPATPKNTSFFKMENQPTHLQIKGKYACVMDNQGKLNIVDVSNSLNPVLVSRLSLSSKFQNESEITISGDYAYLNGDSFCVIDLRDPRHPRELSSTAQFFRCFDTSDKWLLAISRRQFLENNMYLFDINDPSKIAAKATLDLSGAIAKMCFRGHFAYIAEYNGLRTLDISNPRHPLTLGRTGVMGYSDDLFLAGDSIYLDCPTSDGGGEFHGLQIFDISTPGHPKKLGERIPGHTHLSHVFVIGDYAYWWDGYQRKNCWQVLDLRDRKKPKLIPNEFSRHPAHASNDNSNVEQQRKWIFVNSNYFFTVGLSNTLEIYGVSAPLRPALIGSCRVADLSPWHTPAFDIRGNYAYLLSKSGDLQVISIKDPKNPKLEATVSIGIYGGIHVDGHYLYVVNSQLFKVFDIINPTNPILSGECDLPPNIFTFHVYGNYVYVGDYFNLFIFEMDSKGVSVNNDDLPPKNHDGG